MSNAQQVDDDFGLSDSRRQIRGSRLAVRRRSAASLVSTHGNGGLVDRLDAAIAHSRAMTQC
jgi:hypothetical protein